MSGAGYEPLVGSISLLYKESSFKESFFLNGFSQSFLIILAPIGAYVAVSQAFQPLFDVKLLCYFLTPLRTLAIV